jgi:hypothetical protein
MSGLSVAWDGTLPLIIAANPIYIIDTNPAETTFEVLALDSGKLKLLLGVPSQFAIDGQAFSGTLISLKTCESSHPALAPQREKPTLRGIIAILPETGTKH